MFDALHKDYEEILARYNSSPGNESWHDLRRLVDELRTLDNTPRPGGKPPVSTMGVSDFLSGMSKSRIVGRYAHPESYWARSGDELGRIKEVSSEVFAQMSAAMSYEPEYAYMSEMMPNTMAAYKELIREALEGGAEMSVKFFGGKHP